jgi:hypothetical protein
MGLEVLNIIVTTVVGGIASATMGCLFHFVKLQKEANREQKKVNKANALANRSMQRDVLFRYFRIIVEQGHSVTPEEYDHISKCYEAYHANDGNGTGTVMWKKIQENVRIGTGRN